MGVKPSLTTPKGASDRRLTTCKVCPRGIFESDERVWSRKPLGLIHAECATVEVARG